MTVIALRVLKTPNQALKIAGKGLFLGLRQGRRLDGISEIAKVSKDGKRVTTAKGTVFGFLEADGKFAPKGRKTSADVVILDDADLQRAKRRVYMRQYMKGYLARMPKSRLVKRRLYMRKYMKEYMAKRREKRSA